MRKVLGPHFMSGGTGYGSFVAMGPAVTLEVDTFTPESHPDTLKIGRWTGGPQQSWGEGDAIEAANTWWSQALPVIRGNPHIRCWQVGSNEPGWDGPTLDKDSSKRRQAMIWYSTYVVRLCELAAGEGIRPAVGNWSNGCPGPDGSVWQYFKGALMAMRAVKALHLRHCYGELNETYALRHRLDHRAFESMGFGDIQMVIGECGVDDTQTSGGVFPAGWRLLYSSIELYWELWIKPYIQELQKDPYVLGAALYTVGTGGGSWSNFNVVGAELEYVLRKYQELISQSPTTPPPAIGKTYTVVRGDTLSGIAFRMGLRWQTLARINGIVSPYIIRPGQVLQLVADPVVTPPAPPTLPPSSEWVFLSRSDWGARMDVNGSGFSGWDPKTRRLGSLVPAEQRKAWIVHHTVGVDRNDSTPNVWETLEEVAANMRLLQTVRSSDLGPDVPYNYVCYCMADGRLVVAEGRGVERSGAHTSVRNFNREAIAFSFAGNFEASLPPNFEKYMAQLQHCMTFLRASYGLSNVGTLKPSSTRVVWGHRDVYATACPGKLLFAWLDRVLP